MGILVTVALVAMALPGTGTYAGAATPLGTGMSPSAAPNVTVAYSTQLPTYTPLNTSVYFNVTVNGAAITNTTLAVYVVVVDVTNAVSCGSINLNSTVTTTTSATEAFSFGINTTNLATSLANVNCDLYADTIGFVATGNVTGTNQSSAEATTHILGLEPLATGLISPAGSSFGVGNITFLAYASGQYISGIVLEVVQGSTVVFHSILIPSSSYAGQYDPVVWSALSAGTYTVSLGVSTFYSTVPIYQNSTINVTSPPLTTVTKSSWSNSTLIPGMSGPVAGTVLLVVGLIVGMISALVIGRWMMAPKGAAAPQAWSGTGAEKAPNTCPTCGASFGTAEELSSHAKSEHGMG